MKLMGKEYIKFSYFNIIILTLTLISNFLSIVILPQIIVGPPGRIKEVKSIYLVDIWRSQNIVLPNLTNFIVKFGEAYFLRFVLIGVLILSLATLEMMNKNHNIKFIIYMFILIMSISIGYLILFSSVIPMKPL